MNLHTEKIPRYRESFDVKLIQTTILEYVMYINISCDFRELIVFNATHCWNTSLRICWAGFEKRDRYLMS